ncbi:LANO_0F16776g1_1 [Lachancea nothofagi CBS 11611]|uniref:LANO_0F16776g1_1 n=1 Tax=Lachancea nothofagi CBS 11611 TaxID=1266666 RepID=A0A1G4KD35_9SACH|nr:LANO_0F16776g1_1 [Lachancea nothofagi CBS 11611]
MGNTPSRHVRLNDENPNVPPSLRFSRKREMVVATVFGKTRKYMCFSTQHSYERFVNSSRKINTERNLADDGLGVPIFEFEDPHALNRVFSSDGVRFRVYKYVLQQTSDPLPHPNSVVVKQNKSKIIYKMPFCEIHETARGTRSGFEYVFYTPEMNFLVRSKKHHGNLNTDSRLGDWNVRWLGVSNGVYDLVVLPSSVPSLLEDKDIRKSKYASRSNTRETLSNAIVWAKLWDHGEPFLPKLTKKLATIQIGELSLETDAAAYGLCAIPWYSQVIACMAMVQVHMQQEQRRNNGRNRGNTMNFQSNNIGAPFNNIF